MATQITVLLLGGLELVLGSGVFTVFDLHNGRASVIMQGGHANLALEVCACCCVNYVRAVQGLASLFLVSRPSLPMSVNQACSPRAFAKNFCEHSSSNIMAFSYHPWRVHNRMVRFIGEGKQGMLVKALLISFST
eukprot:1144391-Pelagomonas_calceolata.AAC.3